MRLRLKLVYVRKERMQLIVSVEVISLCGLLKEVTQSRAAQKTATRQSK